ncbi:MAG: glycosyltransferase family 2 protein [Candidatus Helarchaeota archaeon]
MKSKYNCSIVIPIYNSQKSIPVLIKALTDTLPNTASEYEIILVNDGGKDGSWECIEEISQLYDNIRAFDLARNFGQHNALLCGIRQAKYEIIVTMDDDLQHPPSEIIKLLDELNRGFDVVYGTPNHETHGFFRNLSSKFTKWALKITTQIPYTNKISAFRAFRTSLRKLFANYNNTYVSLDVLLSWGTTKISFVKVKHNKREFGKSQYTFLRLFIHGLNMILGFSLLPLRVASILGFVFTIFGFLILAYVVIRYLVQGGAVPGFSFLASSLAIFSGIILFVLGIMGEYLARMYSSTLTKPPYMINRQIGRDNE